MNLIEFYKSILMMANIESDEGGYLARIDVTGDKIPITIISKKLVLPIKERLQNKEKEEIMVFHPLQENVLASESIQLDRLKTFLNIKISESVATIIRTCLLIAADQTKHSSLTPDQVSMLSLIPNADKKTLDTFDKINNVSDGTKNDISFVHIFLKKKPIIKDGAGNTRTYNRGAFISFPIYDILVSDDTKKIVNTITKKDKESILALYRYIFPILNDTNTIAIGTDNTTHPYLDSLLKAIKMIGMCINDVTHVMKEHFIDVDYVSMESGWVEQYDDMHSILIEAKQIPDQSRVDEPPPPPKKSNPYVDNSPPPPSNRPPPQPTYYPPQDRYEEPQRHQEYRYGGSGLGRTNETPRGSHNDDPYAHFRNRGSAQFDRMDNYDRGIGISNNSRGLGLGYGSGINIPL